MLFVILGLVLLGLRVTETGAVGQWPWWAVGAPFALAVAWWTLADHFGWTERMALNRFAKRRARRRAKVAELLGLKVGTPAVRPAAEAPASRLPEVRPAASPSAAPSDGPSQWRARVEAPPKEDFGDTVPSTLDVPETLGRREGESARAA